MSAKYTFKLDSRDRKRPLPGKILLAQHETETIAHVLLKLLGFVLFYRERLQIEGDTQNAMIPFRPDLLQLDYDMRPKLWVECGECSIHKLDKLAVKVPDAELWVLKRSSSAARHLLAAMAKEELRRDRYHVLAFDEAMFDELCGLTQERNTMVWFGARMDPGLLQFEYNGLWFEAPFSITHF